MTVIKAEDMHCEKCVERITNAMKEAGLNFQIDLEKKKVMVDDDEQAVTTALEVLDDLGFEGIVQ